MLEIDPKELRKIEAVCFKEAKRNTLTNDMNIYVSALLNNVTSEFLSYFFHSLRSENKDGEVDFESVYNILKERHNDKCANLSSNILYGKSRLRIDLSEGVGIFIVQRYNKDSKTKTDKNSQFCDVVEFIADRIPVWKPIAERIKFAVQKELMKNKISSTAVEALLKAKLNPLGLQYETLVKPQSCNVKIRLSDKKVIKFYLKNAKFLANPDAFVNLITTLDGFVAKGNDFRVKKYYKSNDNHFWI